MSKFPPTPNTIRVRTIGTAHGVHMGNRFFVNYGGPAVCAQGDLSTFVNAFEAAYATRFLPWIAASYTLSEVVAEDLTNDSAPVASWTGSAAGTGGTEGSDATCAVVSWGTTRRYRGGHPRTYIGPLSSAAASAGNVLNPTDATGVANAAIGFQTDVGGMTQPSLDAPQLGAVSTMLDNVARPAGVFEPFTNVRVNNRLGSQRRRLGKLQGYTV